ncbi:MAG: DUF2156 domain-containing protein [Elusimicrobia bacterium]|nr:DUF2156 domain-containing protein [Elusimicrobiota bacterium]
MEFLPLKAGDYPRLKPLFEGIQNPHSEYSLSSMILWDRCVMAADYACDGDAVFFSEIGVDDPKDRFLLLPVSARTAYPPLRLKEKAFEAGFNEYRFVHDDYIAVHGLAEIEKHFTVLDQPGYSDYVYRVKDLASLEGRDLAKKRNNIRQFEKVCALNTWKVETVRLSSANAGACEEVLKTWQTERSGGEWTEVLECESQAIANALKDFDALDLRGLMVLINGAVRGFGIVCRLNDDTGVLLFEKGSDRYKGLYQYLDRECCRQLFDGWEWVNKEGDMQDPGLARAKESYYPAKRVKAHRLVLK